MLFRDRALLLTANIIQPIGGWIGRENCGVAERKIKKAPFPGKELFLR
jgi:hypothetical protein